MNDFSIPAEVKNQIRSAAEVAFPGLVVDWSEKDPELVIPLSMRPKVGEIFNFLAGYAFKLGVVIEFPPMTNTDSTTYPTR